MLGDEDYSQIFDDDEFPEAAFDDKETNVEDKDGDDNNEDDIAAEAARLAKTKSTKKRLDTDLLMTENGIPKLLQEMPKLKFKGPGHEAQDLRMMLLAYEHWAHQLFPAYNFRDFYECVQRKSGNRAFRHYLDEEYRKLKEAKRLKADAELAPEEQEDTDEQERNSLHTEEEAGVDAKRADSEAHSGGPTSAGPRAASNIELSEDVLERMRLNRLKALQKRQERLAAQTAADSTRSGAQAGNEAIKDAEETAAEAPMDFRQRARD